MKALVVLALAGCGTGTAYRTTRIAPSGHTEYLAGMQITGAGTAGVPQDEARGGVAPLPELSIAARRGFADRYEAQVNTTLLDLGAARTGSVELAGKVRLFQHDRWSLATGAGAGYRLADVQGALIESAFVSAPLIGGVELGKHQLALSIDAGFERIYSSGSRPVDLPYAGVSLGFLWQIASSWALLPEAGVEWSPTPNFMSDHSRLFHLGLAVLWTR